MILCTLQQASSYLLVFLLCINTLHLAHMLQHHGMHAHILSCLVQQATAEQW